MSRILVLDDDPACRAVLTIELGLAGLDVHAVNTAAQALRFAEERPPDALVVDMHLRGEHDGVEVARQLRERAPGTPVVLVTGWEGPIELRGLEASVVRKTLADDFVQRVLELLPPVKRAG